MFTFRLPSLIFFRYQQDSRSPAMEKNKIQFAPFMKFVIEFHNSSLSYNKLTNKVAENKALFTEDEIVLVEEAFLVKHLAEWETFLHNIIVYCVAIDTSKISKYLDLDLPKKLSFENATAVVHGLNYLSLTSSSEIKGLAKKIITEENNPFEQFQPKWLNHIDEVYALRNYIAHKSRKSKSNLMKMYTNRHQMTEFVLPGYFLSKMDKNELGEYRHSHLYYGSFMSIATLIWRHLDLESYNFVFEDDRTQEGWLRGMVKMSQVFEMITKEYKL